MAEETHDNIRKVPSIRSLIGSTLVDVTQEDKEEWAEGAGYLAFHFSNGVTLTFPFGPDDEFDVDLPLDTRATSIEDVLSDEDRRRIDEARENQK